MFANAFYRNSEYSADDNILVLTPNFVMNDKIGLFVTSKINLSLKGKFSYAKQYRQKDFNVSVITLPILSNGEIDFIIMEQIIAELEAYLLATGLKDTILTKNEQNALDLFEASRKRERVKAA